MKVHNDPVHERIAFVVQPLTQISMTQSIASLIPCGEAHDRLLHAVSRGERSRSPSKGGWLPYPFAVDVQGRVEHHGQTSTARQQ